MSSRSSKSDKRDILDRFFSRSSSSGDDEEVKVEENKEKLIKAKTSRFVAFSGSDDGPVGFDPFVSSSASSRSPQSYSQSGRSQSDRSTKTKKTSSGQSGYYDQSASGPRSDHHSVTVTDGSASFGHTSTKKSTDECSGRDDKRRKRRCKKQKKKNSNWWVWIIVVILLVLLIAIAGAYYSRRDKGADGRTYGGIGFVVFLLLIIAIIWAVWRD